MRRGKTIGDLTTQKANSRFPYNPQPKPTYQKNVMKYPFMVTPLTTQSANDTLHMSM